MNRGIAERATRMLARAGAASQVRAGLAPEPIVDGAEADYLLRADLIARSEHGGFIVTAAGEAHLARARAAREGRVDPFIGQHLSVAAAMIETEEGRTDVLIDESESPLSWLARRKARDGRPLIEPVQLQAGERLRAQFTRAQMTPRVTTRWSGGVSQGRRGGEGRAAANFSDVIIAARQQVRQAIDAVGPEFSGLLLDVCCFLKGLADVERERGWPSRSAKVVLQLGLDRLARHYGLASEARGRGGRHVLTWHSDGA